MDWTQAALDALAAEIPVAEAAPLLAVRAEGDRLQIDLDGVVGYEVTANGMRRALAEAGGRDITVRINSYGGSVFEGFAVHNQLARYKGRVTVLVDAIAASAASVIAMAGAEIVMPRNAFIMVHNAWTMTAGDYREHDRTSGLLRQLSGAIASLYAARTGRDSADMQAMMDAETWLGADDAIAEGFANSIEGEAQARVPQGRAAELLASYRRAPHPLRALIPTTAAAPPRAQAQPQETSMQPRTTTTTTQDPQPAPAGTTSPAAAAPAAATLQDLQAIAARSHGALSAQWVLDQATAGVTLDAARDAAFEALAAAAPSRTPVVSLVRDERDTFRARAAEGLLSRFTRQAPSAAAREFAGMGLQAMIRECMSAAGVGNAHRLSGDDLFDRIRSEHTTSDFPIILRDAANRRLAQRFAEFPPTWRAWAEELDVNDFREINTGDIGGFPPMKDKPESSSVRYGAVTEDGVTYRISTKSSGVELSREAIINDDLNAFARMLNDASQAGYNAVADAAYAQITANPVMQDGKTLFHADHKNLMTASDLDEGSLGKAEALLIDQTNMDGNAIAPPQRLVLLVPSSRHIRARKLATAVTPDSQDNVGIYGGRLTTVVDPRLASTTSSWYLATPDRPLVEVAYLRGRRVPQLSSMEDFDTLGMKYRLIFDFAAKATSWRGIVKNPGVAPA